MLQSLRGDHQPQWGPQVALQAGLTTPYHPGHRALPAQRQHVQTRGLPCSGLRPRLLSALGPLSVAFPLPRTRLAKLSTTSGLSSGSQQEHPGTQGFNR